MGARFILRGVGVLAFAFVLTSAAMFWLPFFEAKAGRWVTDRITAYYPNTFTDYYPNTFSYDYSYQNLRKRSPVEEWETIDEISNEIKKKPSDELRRLSYSDVCAIDVIDCGSLTTDKVEKIIEATLNDRAAAETARAMSTANWISFGMLFVTFVSVVIAALKFLRKRSQKPSAVIDV